MEDVLATCGCFGLVSGSSLVLWKDCWFTADLLAACFVSLCFCLFIMSVETVSASSFSCPSCPCCFSGQPYFLLSLPKPNLPPCCPPIIIIIYVQLFPLISSFSPLWPTFSFALPHPSFFSALPPSVANPSDRLRVPACSVHTHTYTYAVIASCCRSIMGPSSNQSGTCLLDQPNICLCCLSQSEWRLMRVPVSTCCCFVCFLFWLCERKCAFPARGGSWINSALSAFIPNAQLITAAEGYNVL